MSVIDIQNAFFTEGRSVYDFFQRPGVGFYIPIFQRDYSWDKDNVEQLLEDITKGVSAMIESENEIRFLGTIITVQEKDRRRIQPLELPGLPATIDKIIDGQQRLSTIALFATQLYKYFDYIENRFNKNSQHYSEIQEICSAWKAKLVDIFSFDLKSGSPTRKPKIIRAYKDVWTKQGDLDEKYITPISNYLAKFISAINQGEVLPDVPKNKDNYSVNTRTIDLELKKIISIHETDDDLIPPAWEILEREENHDLVWSYKRDHLRQLVDRKEKRQRKSDEYLVCSLVQLSAVCHYLLERCCFTTIQPINEDWAFDMFQSLNASGTPLTAIETFLPLVVNTTEFHNERFEDSKSKIWFGLVEELFKDLSSASTKSKLTNEFLTSFALVVEGAKLETHFSSQRKFLSRVYENSNLSYKQQCDFINFFGNYAEFYRKVWREYEGVNNKPLDTIAQNPEGELASLLILFLKKSNHKMAITILGMLYSDLLNGGSNSIPNFVEGVKAISAFYILWRGCDSNAKLDSFYRFYFKGKDGLINENSWMNSGGVIDIQKLKSYLREVIFTEKGTRSKQEWVTKAAGYLKYETSTTISRIALFISSHDTIVDESQPGIMKKGKKGCSSYLNLEKWNSTDLKEIEHIAPKQNDNQWDEGLYDPNSNLFDSIGNLTLLPDDLNKSAGNKGWKEKFIYYSHIGTNDPQKAQELSNRAIKEGIILNPNTIELLKNASYFQHVLPILKVGENGQWDEDLVKNRSVAILEHVYDTVISWLD
jgi:hypothetical protein